MRHLIVKKFNDFNKINENSINALIKSYNKDMLNAFGNQEMVDDIISINFSNPMNHIKDVYYHVNTKRSDAYSGVGNGFYIGKDPYALLNFYDHQDLGYTITKYIGHDINWLDLTDNIKYKEFINTFMKKHNTDNIVNSDVFSNYVIDMGYDGIRYFDPYTTGEEFVLFNNKLTKIDTYSRKELSF